MDRLTGRCSFDSIEFRFDTIESQLATKLCEPALTDQAAVEAHLFDAFIPAVYRSPTSSRWTAKQAQTWLEFLACHLEYTIGSPDLAWWQLAEAVPATAFALVAGLATGLLAAMPGI